MDLHSSVTLGDPEFPPKNGVIIKQGDIFVQENRKVLFVKWKVWRKRFVTLRYRAKASASVLQIDPSNTFIMSSVSYNLTSETNVTIVDCSGPQDLATAQVLQLIINIDEHSAPVIFKHPSLDEMNDWLAAFRLTLALGETGSICSDTDSSIWTGSQAAASPVGSESPVAPFPFDKPTVFLVRLTPCDAQQELGLSLHCDYQLHIDNHDFSLRASSTSEGTPVPDNTTPSAAWPLLSVHKIEVKEQSLEDARILMDILHVLMLRPGRAEERKASLLTLSCAEDCTKLHDMLKTAVAQVHNGEHFNRSTESEHSVQRSEKPGVSVVKRRAGSEMRKKPLLDLIRQSSLLSSSELLSPVLPRGSPRDRPINHQGSARRRMRTINRLTFADSRESSNSGEADF